MKYLITGGAGFIGSNIAFALEDERKAEVVIVDNFSSGHFKNLIGFKGDIIADDIANDSWYDKAGKVDAIFHEAAITDTTVTDQKEMMRINVGGFRSVLNYALKYDIKTIVYASSAAVYGNGKCPMQEDQDLTPENVYGFSKAMMDNVAMEFAARHKEASLVGLRYFNVYGPREFYKGKFASMIYQLYLQMKEYKRPKIFKFGEQMRDFVYVKDIVRANLNALDAGKFCVCNAASGKPENFNKVIECLNSAMGRDLSPRYFDNPYDFYQNKTQADLRLAKAYINYRPEWDIECGIRDYVKILDGEK
ncbi:MAG: ADP-glyceromanno-heptose 6-epimerase [Elusimicrobia bacterium]|nr:ADP-glyceromanno-heptose 6-epimerase [Elusimicrobiota bacterium]